MIRIAVFLIAGAAGALLPNLFGSPLLLTLLTQAVISAILATGVGFLVRQNGLVSFGHAGFFGLGAYIVALSATNAWMPIGATLVVAILAPTVLALLLGAAMLRLGGVAFSMLTLAVAQAFYELALRWRSLANGDDGIAAQLPDRILGLDISVFQQAGSMFVVCWIVLVLVLFGLSVLIASPFGTLTLAIRENEERARFIGYGTIVPRAAIYALSAAIAALAGVLFALYNGFVTPNVLYWGLSGEALVMAVVGGTRAVWGPALGALLFFLLKNAAGDLTDHWPAIIGGTLIVVTVLLPRGASGTIAMLMQRMGVRTA
nr:branched-chain amino acid ABC transporter permease [uncultured Rhodopila sp.]